MKKYLLFILLFLSLLAATNAQGITGPNPVRYSLTDPTGNACDANSPPLVYGTGSTRNIYTCQSGVYAVGTGSGSIPSATATVEGKAVLGAQAAVPFASLGTCAAGNRGQRKQLTDLNKGTRTCTLTTGSTYAWVDDEGGVYNVTRFGASPSASAATNDAAIAAAIAAAPAGSIIYIPPGSYSISAVINAGARILRGAGWDNTTINQTGAAFAIALDDLGVVEDLVITGDSDCDGGIDLSNNGWLEVNRVYIRDLPKAGAIGIKFSSTYRAAINWVFIARMAYGCTFENTTTTKFDTVEILGSTTNALKTYGVSTANNISFYNTILESNECTTSADFSVGFNTIAFRDGWVEDEGDAGASPVLFNLGDAYDSLYIFENNNISPFRTGFSGTATFIYAPDNCPNVRVTNNRFNTNTSSVKFIRSGGAGTNLIRQGNSYIYQGGAVTGQTMSGFFTLGASVVENVTSDRFLGSSGSAFFVNKIGYNNKVSFGILTSTPKADLVVGHTDNQGSNIPSTWAGIFIGRLASAQADKAVFAEINGSNAHIDAYDYGAGAAVPIQIGANGANVRIGDSTSATDKLEVVGAARVVGGTLKLTNATVTATSGGTTTLDLSIGNIRTVTMPAGNTTFALSSVPVGIVNLAIIQDGTGGRTVTFPSTIKNGTSTLDLQPSPGANERTQYTFQCDGTNCILTGYQPDGFGATGTATATAGAATLNTQRGVITSEALTTAAGSTYALTITNSKVTTSSIVTASVQNGTNSVDNYYVQRITPGSGSVTIVIYNASGGALNGTIKVSFIVM